PSASATVGAEPRPTSARQRHAEAARIHLFRYTGRRVRRAAYRSGGSRPGLTTYLTPASSSCFVLGIAGRLGVSQSDARIVIVGAGHAGGSAAALLRQYGWKGPITLVGEEPVAPYQRPPLSKAWLKGEADAASLALRPDSFYPTNNIALRLATSAVGIDRAAQAVALSSGETLAYDHLILALGARPRRLSLPGLSLTGVLELRTVADADQLKAALAPGKRLAVIGGGYIGLEAAASARALGAE